MKDFIKKNSEKDEIEESVGAFFNEPICLLIKQRVKDGQFKSKVDYIQYKEYALDKEQILALRMAVDRHYGLFLAKLKKTYPKLTKIDIDYCCLYILGLSAADIAALMQRAYNTVIERDGKLRNIFGCEGAISDKLWDFIYNQ